MAVLLGALYLYATWSDRRKKRKARSAAEENDPLSDGTVNDFEKGIARANQQENRDGFMVRPPDTRTRKVPLTVHHMDSIFAATRQV